jgi:anaerobic magnesium-protoporphyrin IX monomethyl ester cyclase
MRTLLINPPYPLSEVPIIPMGIAYIASVLEQNGYEVQVLDLLVSRESKDKIRRKLEEFQPDFVGTTCVTVNYHIASDILKYCKQVNKEITTIIGGPHVSFTAAETLNEAPWIDIVAVGEGEFTMLDLVKGKKYEDTPGIAFRANGNIERTAQRPLVQNLDELPLPARHLFPLSRYHALDAACSLMAGRGCPFSCIFCVGSRMGGRRMRYRNPKLVVDEIERCLGYGFTEIHIENDLLTLNQKHLYALCDEIMSRGLKFNWSAFARVDTVNPEMLRRMKEAGCSALLYGVESGVQEILDKIKKKITLEQARKAVKMANEVGIDVQATFILGLPGETKETLAQTLQFAQELDAFYGLHVLAPFPGTEVREKAKEYGLEILTSDWSKYDCNRPVTRTEGCSPEDIISLLYRYYMGLRLTQDDLRGVNTGQAEIEKEKRKPPLAWALLKNDIIESLCPIKLDKGPVEDLAAKVAQHVTYPQHQILSSVKSWVDKGILKYDLKDSHTAWRWG